MVGWLPREITVFLPYPTRQPHAIAWYTRVRYFSRNPILQQLFLEMVWRLPGTNNPQKISSKRLKFRVFAVVRNPAKTNALISGNTEMYGITERKRKSSMNESHCGTTACTTLQLRWLCTMMDDRTPWHVSAVQNNLVYSAADGNTQVTGLRKVRMHCATWRSGVTLCTPVATCASEPSPKSAEPRTQGSLATKSIYIIAKNTRYPDVGPPW